MIDFRCNNAQPGLRAAGDDARCQLLAGHEGPHAVMFCRAGRRTVRTWRDSDAGTIRDQHAAQPNLPWSTGMPRSAWAETA